MSADRIGLCPKCKCWTLREYYYPAFQHFSKECRFVFEYSAECNDCDFRWETNIDKLVNLEEDK